jgi:hypothetical protein
MNRLFWLVLGLALTASPGCMLLPKSWQEARGTKSDLDTPPPRPQAVFKEDVTATNLPQQVEALRRELDYEETHPPSQVTIHTVDGVK